MAPVIESLAEESPSLQGGLRLSSESSAASTAASLTSPARCKDASNWRQHWWSLQRSWETFSLFHVNKEDDTPRVWGNRVKSRSRRPEDPSASRDDSFRQVRRVSSELAQVVRQHTYHDEMRLQLRDERIRLSYLDAFEMDTEPGAAQRKVRVFSLGATLLEYLKIALAVWTFFTALTTAAFWEVVEPREIVFADLAADLLFATCLLVQLQTTILHVESGRETCSSRRILSHNLRDLRFWLDVVSCMPLVLVGRPPGAHGASRWAALLKALRGWRISRTPPEHRFVPSARFLLLQLAGAMLMGGHLLACVWFVLVFEKENTMAHHLPDSYSESGGFWELYVVSLNQGVYLLLGIDRDAYSSSERAFVTVCAPAGVLVHAFVFGKIILLIQRSSALETKQNEHTLAVQEAMRILGLPADLQMRIVAFFTYERIHRSGRLFQTLFSDLSPQLRFELQFHLYLDLVGKSGLFREARPRVIREIIVNLEDVIFLPGDWICRHGDYGDSMYFVIKGSCAILDKDTVTQLKTLERGAYFGEVALLTGVPRTAYVRASTFCIMAQLTKDRFEPIVKKWPEEIDVLIRSVERQADKDRIKREASRHFGLTRRVSQLSTGSGADGCRATGWPSRSARRRSDLSLSSATSAPRARQPRDQPIHTSIQKALSSRMQACSLDTASGVVPTPNPTLLTCHHQAEVLATDKLHSQLSEAASQMAKIRSELLTQREALTEGLAGLRCWTLEAVQDFISREAMENLSTNGDEFDGSSADGYGSPSSDVSMEGLSTPFT
jgi:CRP-like cAMP-binding protein